MDEWERERRSAHRCWSRGETQPGLPWLQVSVDVKEQGSLQKSLEQYVKVRPRSFWCFTGPHKFNGASTPEQRGVGYRPHAVVSLDDADTGHALQMHWLVLPRQRVLFCNGLRSRTHAFLILFL